MNRTFCLAAYLQRVPRVWNDFWKTHLYSPLAHHLPLLITSSCSPSPYHLLLTIYSYSLPPLLTLSPYSPPALTNHLFLLTISPCSLPPSAHHLTCHLSLLTTSPYSHCSPPSPLLTTSPHAHSPLPYSPHLLPNTSLCSPPSPLLTTSPCSPPSAHPLSLTHHLPLLTSLCSPPSPLLTTTPCSPPPSAHPPLPYSPPPAAHHLAVSTYSPSSPARPCWCRRGCRWAASSWTGSTLDRTGSSRAWTAHFAAVRTSRSAVAFWSGWLSCQLQCKPTRINEGWKRDLLLLLLWWWWW